MQCKRGYLPMRGLGATNPGGLVSMGVELLSFWLGAPSSGGMYAGGGVSAVNKIKMQDTVRVHFRTALFFRN